MTYDICVDCTYPKPEGETCPNPACWPGLAEWHKAMQIWSQERDAAYARHRERFPYTNRPAWEEGYERTNPRPAPDEFRKKV